MVHLQNEVERLENDLMLSRMENDRIQTEYEREKQVCSLSKINYENKPMYNVTSRYFLPLHILKVATMEQLEVTVEPNTLACMVFILK